MALSSSPRLGVVIVSFETSHDLLDCVESLLAATGVRLDIVVVDNASRDGTPDLLRDWAAGRLDRSPSADTPFPIEEVPKPVTIHDVPPSADPEGHRLTLIEAGVNGGYAAGVNRGLAALMADKGLERVWVLNPDSIIPAETPQAFATEPGPAEGFALMGGRVLYLETPEIIQMDGGTINRRTGVTGNLGLGARSDDFPMSDPDRIDFISGASMVASRAFYETTGPMLEDYFLYYEEVDWALRRGTLPLAYCPDGVVYHRAGTAIGSPTLNRPASPFSQYFKHRARLMFVRRHFPWSLPTAIAYSLAKAAQLRLKGYRAEARAVLDGSFGRPPAAEIRERLSPEAQALAFR